MRLKISESNELQHRLQSLKTLSKTIVSVGLPETTSPHLKFILLIQEHGSPINNIPPRPVIQPALHQTNTRTAMSDAMLTAVHAAWTGSDPTPYLHLAGRTGANSIRAHIDSHIPPPNKPSTVSRKGFDLPLYDTGALYRAFDYEVTQK